MSNGQPAIKAQVSLELIASLIICLVLMVGIARIFVWMNESIVKREQDYQKGRKISSKSHINNNKIDDKLINFYTPKKLYIFTEEKAQ